MLSDSTGLWQRSETSEISNLKELTLEYGETTPIWFIEDRLKTLETVKKQAGLENVTLFLADWGYNTIADQQSALKDDRIHRLSLAQFTQDFEGWSV